MTKQLLLGLLLASLTACATVTTPPPATDLQLLRAGVDALTQPRTVAGPIQKRSDAETNDELWKYAGAREDMSELSEGDKARTRQFVHEASTIIEKARLPVCHFWQFACKKRAKQIGK